MICWRATVQKSLPSIVTLFSEKSLVRLSQNPWYPLPLRPWRHLWTALSHFSSWADGPYYKASDDTEAGYRHKKLLTPIQYFQFHCLFFNNCTLSLFFLRQILPGLYIGNFRDSKDCKQLDVNRITHILSIHDDAKKLFKVTRKTKGGALTFWSKIRFQFVFP